MFVCLFVCLFVWWCGARVQVGARLLGVESRQPTLASCRTVSSAIKSHNNLLLTTFVLQPNTNIKHYCTYSTCSLPGIIRLNITLYQYFITGFTTSV